MNFQIEVGFLDMPFPSADQFSEDTPIHDLVAALRLHDFYLKQIHPNLKHRIEHAKTSNPALAVEQQHELRVLRSLVQEQATRISNLQHESVGLSKRLRYHKKVSGTRLKKFRKVRDSALGEVGQIRIDESVDSLRISVRAANCLKAENVYLIRDLVQMTENEVFKIPQMGRHTLAGLKEALRAHGLSLGTVFVSEEGCES